MKIGIIGTRGIPNRYGGFEQFVEFIAPALVNRGHTVFVYNSSLHPYEASSWKGVQLIKKFDPENRIGTFGQFIYDFNCIFDSRSRKYDIILQLGYTSSSIWSFLFPKKAVIVTNMDGLEWKRSKYSGLVRGFLKKAEKWAVLHSDQLIADSTGIQDYLYTNYKKQSDFIAYGATVFTEPDVSALAPFNLEKHAYNLVIARMEPENNIETILQGYTMSGTKNKLVLAGNYTNKFGVYLKNKYKDERIHFLGPLYDFSLLNNLRYFSNLYFHGHSVGGTNPSLLEAMASHALIVAHDNIFNKSILQEDAFYFSTAADITAILNNHPEKSSFSGYLENNESKITRYYSWDHITNLLEACFTKAIQSRPVNHS